MLKFLWKALPSDYKFKFAARNIGIGVGKVATSLIAGWAGKKLSPAHIDAVGVAVTVITQTGLEAIHDWAKVKWPDSKWL